MRGLIFFILVTFPLKNLFSQHKINSFNSHGKKDGYWSYYLDSNLIAIDSSKAKYLRYIYFDNGKQISITKRYGGKKLKIIKDSVLPTKEINGTFKWYIPSHNQIMSEEHYKNGYAIVFKSFSLCNPFKKDIAFLDTYIDFSKLYENQTGSYYYETYDYKESNLIITNKYFFAKINGKWKSIKVF